MADQKSSKETRFEYYRHGKYMAERILSVCNDVLSGGCESAACRKEDISVRWMRRFVRKDIGVDSENRRREKPEITDSSWYCWEDAFLTDLIGEECYVPEGFDEVFEECLARACTMGEQKVLRLRYQEEKTLEEIGRELNIHRYQVYQFREKALRRLRAPKYRLLLVYGPEYRETLAELQSAQAEYDRAKLARMEECRREREKAIAECREEAAKLRRQTESIGGAGLEELSELDLLPVEELELSIRTYKCLKNPCIAGKDGKSVSQDPIRTIGQLSRMTRKELSKIRNLGRRSLKEIEDVLEKTYGIVLQD
ncbi:MAG: hypothetical protein LUE86_02105 [Clostridiales bacterium]|nr:hypothetical protein [Clostridiales bacterium]